MTKKGEEIKVFEDETDEKYHIFVEKYLRAIPTMAGDGWYYRLVAINKHPSLKEKILGKRVRKYHIDNEVDYSHFEAASDIMDCLLGEKSSKDSHIFPSRVNIEQVDYKDGKIKIDYVKQYNDGSTLRKNKTFIL